MSANGCHLRPCPRGSLCRVEGRPMSNLLKSALAGLVLAVCLFGVAVAGPAESNRSVTHSRQS